MKNCPTKRVLERAGVCAIYKHFAYAWLQIFPAPKQSSRPAHLRLTQTVSLLAIKHQNKSEEIYENNLQGNNTFNPSHSISIV